MINLVNCYSLRLTKNITYALAKTNFIDCSIVDTFPNTMNLKNRILNLKRLMKIKNLIKWTNVVKMLTIFINLAI
jgi:hypothetical protein